MCDSPPRSPSTLAQRYAEVQKTSSVKRQKEKRHGYGKTLFFLLLRSSKSVCLGPLNIPFIEGHTYHFVETMPETPKQLDDGTYAIYVYCERRCGFVELVDKDRNFVLSLPSYDREKGILRGFVCPNHF